MPRHLATIGRLTVWLSDRGEFPLAKGTTVNLVTDSKYGAVLDLDQSVELARLLVKTAAQHGWGSDEEKQRIIAWAQVKK